MTIKFFIIPIYPYGNDHYFHEMICLAEGLIELGHKVYGNVNYWMQFDTNTYLIKESHSNDFDVAVYDYRYAKSFEHLLMRKGHPNFQKDKLHVLIDRNDWISPFWTKKGYEVFDIIFSGNLYSKKKYPQNIKPWAIGLTKRIITEIDKFHNTQEQANKIGYNFRVPHNMRKHVFENIAKLIQPYPLEPAFTKSPTDNKTIHDNDLQYYKSTTRRHNPEYYKLLDSYRFFLAFGGYMEYKPILYQPYTTLDRIKRKPYYYLTKFLKKRNYDLSKSMFIFQHDNFRFYESLYSKSIPINIDLAEWGFLLPSMPINGLHYIGIKNFNFIELEKCLCSLSNEQLQQISVNGRTWVMDNYSPKAMAKYFLHNVKLLTK